MTRTSRHAALAAIVALASLAAVPAAAQDDDLPRRVAPPGAMEPEEVFSIVTTRRARLGVKVNLQARETDSIGAYVEGVTPGGPADKAGIRTGDVIARLDGTALVDAGPRRDASGERSLPGLRLIELAAQLEPNDTVAVELRRGKGWKERKTVRLVTANEPSRVVLRGGGPGDRRGFTFHLGPEGERAWREMEFDHLPWGGGELPRMRMFFGSPFGQLELAALNADLGQYFGTTEGVLVISAPKDSKLNLKGGDVVLAVDGREPSSPAHLLRILRSYEGGERIRLDIMRNRRRETVTATFEQPKLRLRTPERRVEPARRRSTPS